MSYVETIPGCPTCGKVPFSPSGKYPWYDFEAGDRIALVVRNNRLSAGALFMKPRRGGRRSG